MGKVKTKKKAVFNNSWDWLFWLIVIAIVFVIFLGIRDRNSSIPSPNTAQQTTNTTTPSSTSSNQAPAVSNAGAINDMKVNVKGVDANSPASKIKVKAIPSGATDTAGSSGTAANNK